MFPLSVFLLSEFDCIEKLKWGTLLDVPLSCVARFKMQRFKVPTETQAVRNKTSQKTKFHYFFSVPVTSFKTTVKYLLLISRIH